MRPERLEYRNLERNGSAVAERSTGPSLEFRDGLETGAERQYSGRLAKGSSPVAAKGLGTATLSNGTTTLNTTCAGGGSLNLKATYQGAGNYVGSSATAVQTVQ